MAARTNETCQCTAEAIFHIACLDELVVKGQRVNESRRGTEQQQADLCVRQTSQVNLLSYHKHRNIQQLTTFHLQEGR